MTGEQKELRNQQQREALEWRLIQSELFAGIHELLGDSLLNASDRLSVQEQKVKDLSVSVARHGIEIEAARKSWLGRFSHVKANLQRHEEELSRLTGQLEEQEKLLHLMRVDFDRKQQLMEKLRFRIKQFIPEDMRVPKAGPPDLKVVPEAEASR